MEKPHCPICGGEIEEKIRINKNEERPLFNPTDHCNNEWFIHLDDKLYLISHPKLYKVKIEESVGTIKPEHNG